VEGMGEGVMGWDKIAYDRMGQGIVGRVGANDS